MSTYAVVKCHNCSQKFELYWSDLPDLPFKCPHCMAVMDEHMSNDLKTAIATVHDLNYHFKKYHSENQEPLFAVDIKEK